MQKQFIYLIDGVYYKRGSGGYALYLHNTGWRESAFFTNQKLLEYPAYTGEVPDHGL